MSRDMYANQTLENNPSEEEKRLVWNRALPVYGNDPSIFRKDSCLAWISFKEYGNRKSPFGWEIDHYQPVSHGGSDSLHNLNPLQWENNLNKSDGKLKCVITSRNTINVRISNNIF